VNSRRIASGCSPRDLVEELHARHLGHALVAHDDVHFLLLHQADALGGASGAQDLVIEAEQVLDALDDVGLVIDDEHGVAALLGHGSVFRCCGSAGCDGSFRVTSELSRMLTQFPAETNGMQA
jgi:hypothetical protein